MEIHWHGKPSQCEVAYSKKVCLVAVAPDTIDTIFRTGPSSMLHGLPLAHTLRPSFARVSAYGEVLLGTLGSVLLTLLSS